MSNPDSLYALLLSLSAGSCLALVGLAWRRRDKPGALSVAAFMLAIAQWSLSYAIHWLAEPDWRWFWLNMTYFGAVAVPPAFLLFALVFTHREKWVTKGLLLGLLVHPAVALTLLWTDETHNLFFGGKRAADATFFLDGGVGFWLHVGYSYLLMLIGFALLAQMFFRAQRPYRRQAGLVLLGASLPWLSNMLSFGGVRPPGLDLTPVFFVLTGAIFAVGLFRVGLLDLAPVARDRLIEIMADGVLALDAADRIIDVNPAAAKLLGQSQETLIGQPIDVFLQLWPEKMERLRYIIHGREETWTRSQPTRYFEVHIAPLHDDQMQLTGRLITWRNISSRKTVELERENLIRELAAYAHTVAHDLKAPLIATMGYSEMLLEMNLFAPDDERAVFLNRIHANNERMLRIVDELLTLASVRKQEDIPLEPLNMTIWVAAALERLESEVRESRGEIHLPEQWLMAVGYGPWIEEVWMNYISNALKYGGPPPQATLGCDTVANGMIRFWIKDNGAGVDAAAQGRLFQEFERLERKRAQGHGLGLSVVSRIIKKLGGEVGVESEAGAGSLFYFTLPTTVQLTAVNENDHRQQNKRRNALSRFPQYKAGGSAAIQIQGYV